MDGDRQGGRDRVAALERGRTGTVDATGWPAVRGYGDQRDRVTPRVCQEREVTPGVVTPGAARQVGDTPAGAGGCPPS